MFTSIEIITIKQNFVDINNEYIMASIFMRIGITFIIIKIARIK